MRYLSALGTIGSLWRKKSRVDEIDANFCIEETCDRAHGCTVKAITEGELVLRFGTYSNVRRICPLGKLFTVTYR